ncbi:hypothetical protein [Bowmanella denitrificans]|uniref:hypothetical protein n=1 Tax=Bowmanella denitrificans TaxID=366582 RepID=UPI0011AEE28F|nr:hypothetical protein [Bowmanella denitrificans]
MSGDKRISSFEIAEELVEEIAGLGFSSMHFNKEGVSNVDYVFASFTNEDISDRTIKLLLAAKLVMLVINGNLERNLVENFNYLKKNRAYFARLRKILTLSLPMGLIKEGGDFYLFRNHVASYISIQLQDINDTFKDKFDNFSHLASFIVKSI